MIRLIGYVLVGIGILAALSIPLGLLVAGGVTAYNYVRGCEDLALCSARDKYIDLKARVEEGKVPGTLKENTDRAVAIAKSKIAEERARVERERREQLERELQVERQRREREATKTTHQEVANSDCSGYSGHTKEVCEQL